MEQIMKHLLESHIPIIIDGITVRISKKGDDLYINTTSMNCVFDKWKRGKANTQLVTSVTKSGKVPIYSSTVSGTWVHSGLWKSFGNWWGDLNKKEGFGNTLDDKAGKLYYDWEDGSDLYFKPLIRKNTSSGTKTRKILRIKRPADSDINIVEFNSVNLGDICNAYEKDIRNWKKTKGYKDYIEENPDTVQSSNSTLDEFGKRCSYGHPDAARVLLEYLKDKGSIKLYEIINKFITAWEESVNWKSEEGDEEESEEESKEESEEESDDDEVKIAPVVSSGELILKGVTIQSRESDGFINATQMCKAGGKLFKDWSRLSSTNDLMNELSSNGGIIPLDLIDVSVGGNHSGSWIHPDLAVQLAQWISPSFAIQVSRWIDKINGVGIVIEVVKVIETVPMNSGELVLNETTIQSRESDGFINATQMCKAGRREMRDWNRLEATKKLMNELSSNVGIPTIELIDSTQGHNGGSWIHPDLAVQLAQWISPSFAIQVSRWIRELVYTGSVNLSSTKTDEHLKKLAQRPQVNILPYKDCDAVYILSFTPTDSSVITKNDCYKFGVTQDISSRLTQHEADKAFSDVIVTDVFKCNSRTQASDIEKAVKRFTKNSGLYLECGNKKECFTATETEYDLIKEHIVECLGLEITGERNIVPRDYKSEIGIRAMDMLRDKEIEFSQLLQIIDKLSC
jgi:predicted GIY-YIG superfamily endonuclease